MPVKLRSVVADEGRLRLRITLGELYVVGRQSCCDQLRRDGIQKDAEFAARPAAEKRLIFRTRGEDRLRDRKDRAGP